MNFSKYTKAELIDLVGSLRRSLAEQATLNNKQAEENKDTASRLDAHYRTLRKLGYHCDDDLKVAEETADASGLFGYGGTAKEPETEVGYLRRELSYAQGQLHQSHLTVKELCRKGGLSAPQPNTDVIRQAEETLDRISNVLHELQKLVADQVNRRDLVEIAATWSKQVEEGIKPSDKPFNVYNDVKYMGHVEKHGLAFKKGESDGGKA